MKRSSLALILFPAIVLAALAAALPRQSVAAEDCYNDKQEKIPCPKKPRPTVIYPSFTPSSTFTLVPSDTPTLVPTLTPTSTPTRVPPPVVDAPPAAPVNTSGGFTCPPYRSSVPLGAALLGLGLLLVVGGSRVPSTGLTFLRVPFGNSAPTVSVAATTNEPGASGGAEQESTDNLEDRAPRELLGDRQHGITSQDATRSSIPGATQSAAVMGPGSGTGWRRGLMQLLRRLSLLSPRDPASGLPAMNQGDGGASGAIQGTGAGVAGAGAGVLGAGLLAGWLGLNCIGAPILLPSAAAAGLAAALAGAVGLRGAWSQASHATANGDIHSDGVSSTFELIGAIQGDGSVTGSAGLYRSKDLE